MMPTSRTRPWNANMPRMACGKGVRNSMSVSPGKANSTGSRVAGASDTANEAGIARMAASISVREEKEMAGD